MRAGLPVKLSAMPLFLRLLISCLCLNAHAANFSMPFPDPLPAHPRLLASTEDFTAPLAYAETDQPERWKKFQSFMFAQIEELMKFKPDIWWFDGIWERTHETNREGITSRITLPRDTEAIFIPPPGLIIDSIDGKPPENRAKAVFRSTEPVIIHTKPAEPAQKSEEKS